MYSDPSGHSVIPTVFSLLDLAITYASSMIGNAVTFIGASVANAVTIVATSFELATTTAIAVATSIIATLMATKNIIYIFDEFMIPFFKKMFSKNDSLSEKIPELIDPSQREGITENIARFSNEAGGSLKSYLDCYDVFYVDDEVNILQ